MRSRPVLLAVAFATAAGPAARQLVADKPNWGGKVGWTEVPPKVYPAEKDGKPGVEVLGKYKPVEGWTAKKARLDYLPRQGGSITAVEKKIELSDGQFGAVDPKTKKVVPLKIPIEPGKWTVRVVVTYERTVNGDTAEGEATTSWEHIEVK